MKQLSNISGVTAVEMLIYVGIFGVIIPTILGGFVQVMRVSTFVVNKQMSANKTTIASNLILADIRSASRSALGSFLTNGGFEWEESTSQPKTWPAAVTGNGTYTYHRDYDPNNIPNGSHSLAMKSTDGTEVTLDSHNFTLSTGAAYMITATIKSANAAVTGRVSLMDGNTTVAFVESAATSWQKLSVRYPASGLYAHNGINGNVGKIRLIVRPSATVGTDVIFDDVAFTRIHSVLSSTSTAGVNVNSVETSMTDPNDSAGFRFWRWQDETLRLYRYRNVAVKNPYLSREIFDTTAVTWKSASPNMPGLKMTITYDETSALPANGKNSPVTIYLTYKDNATLGETEKFRLYPMAP